MRAFNFADLLGELHCGQVLSAISKGGHGLMALPTAQRPKSSDLLEHQALCAPELSENPSGVQNKSNKPHHALNLDLCC